MKKKSIEERARELHGRLPIIQDDYISTIEDALKEQDCISYLRGRNDALTEMAKVAEVAAVKLTLGQTFFYVDYFDNIKEGKVTSIVLEMGKEPILYCGRDEIMMDNFFLNIEDIRIKMLDSNEERFEKNKKRILEMYDEFVNRKEE